MDASAAGSADAEEIGLYLGIERVGHHRSQVVIDELAGARLKFLTARPARLECLAEAPRNVVGVQEKMDAFSEVLSGVRLNGALFFSAQFSAPWRISTPHCRTLTPALAPGAQHLLIYHFVVEGSARARLEGGPDVELSPGDIVVFPHGDPHHLIGG